MIDDKDKSKEELIQELEALRQRVDWLTEAGKAEHQCAEERLRKSEQIHRTVFLHSPDYIYLNDTDGFFLDANPAVLEVHGLSLEEFQKKSFLDFFAGDNLDELIRVSEGLREGRPVFGLRLRIRSARGQIIEMEINAVPIFGNGKVVSVLSMARDVTARMDAEAKLKQAYDEMETRVTQRTVELVKANQGLRSEIAERQRAEAALRGSEELYRALMKTYPDAVMVADLEGRIMEISKNALKLLGLEEAEEMIGRNTSEFAIPKEKERIIENREKLLREGSYQDVGFIFRKKDGTTIDVEVNASLLRDVNNRPNAIVAVARDVSERKRAEEAIRESEKIYRTLVETSFDGISLTGLDGKIRDLSPKARELFGIDRLDSVIGKDALILLAPEVRERAQNRMADALNAGEVSHAEYTALKSDGSRFFAEVNNSLIRDQQGQPQVFVTTIRDISERKRAEEALRESEEMYRTLVETSPDVIAVLDLEGRMTYATGKIYEMYGYEKEEEFLGKKVLDFVSPEDRERAASNLMKSARLGSLRGNEYPILRKDGKVVVTEVSSAVIRDAHGLPKGMIAINRDVTERKRSEEALRESEEMYRILVETSPDAIITTDLESRVTGASRRALEIFGTDKKEDLVGKMSFELTDPKEHQEIKRNIKKLWEVKIVRNVERTFFRPNGTSFLGEISAAPLTDAQRTAKGLFITIRDITERKRLEKEILEIGAREQRRIGHNLHDGLGQHLTAISFMNKVLENKLAAKSPAEAREMAKISKLVSEAISQTRDLARGINPVELKADGLMVSLRQLSVNLERLFKVSCAFQCARRVLVDDNIISTNLYYIAQEATNNAIKHGKAKHVKIRLAVVRNKLTLSVSDDGVGIPDDFKPNGGLGLQIMNYRSKIIGANLNILPGRKSGTTVTCSLPAPSKNLH